MAFNHDKYEEALALGSKLQRVLSELELSISESVNWEDEGKFMRAFDLLKTQCYRVAENAYRVNEPPRVKYAQKQIENKKLGLKKYGIK